MINAKLQDGREVRILFFHNDYKKRAKEVAKDLGIPEDVALYGIARDERVNKPGVNKFYTHSTLCSIVVGPKEEEIDLATGQSWCALGDNFCRATGREYALRRAIENGGFNRSDIGTLLASYFNRNRGQRRDKTVTKQEDN